VVEDHEEEEIEALYRLSCEGDDTLGRGIYGDQGVWKKQKKGNDVPWTARAIRFSNSLSGHCRCQSGVLYIDK